MALRRDLDTLTDELCRLVLPLPSYIGVAETDLRPLVSAGLQSVLPAVIEGRPPSRGETTGYPEIIDSLAGLGVSLEDILQGWHLTHSVLRTWVRRQSPEEVATEIHGELEDLIYEWTSQGISVLVEAYRESQARSPQDAEQRQASFVRRVLLGDAAPAEIELHCRVHGLSPSGAFHALRAPAGTLRPVRSWLRLAGPTGRGGGLAAVVDGEIWGSPPGSVRGSRKCRSASPRPWRSGTCPAAFASPRARCAPRFASVSRATTMSRRSASTWP